MVYWDTDPDPDTLDEALAATKRALDTDDHNAVFHMLRGRVQLTVRKDMKLTWPRGETATDYISMASDEDLKTATMIAVQEMIDFLAATRPLTRHEAYQLVSIAGNVAVTQLVDKPVYGVHVRMPKAIFQNGGS